jgi:hypothetical protein
MTGTLNQSLSHNINDLSLRWNLRLNLAGTFPRPCVVTGACTGARTCP